MNGDPEHPDRAAGDLIIRRATLGELIDLRHQVLRQNLPRESAIFKGDDAPAALHFGAFAGARTVACVSLHPSEWETAAAWQLRGMATAPDYRGRGVGRRLMQVMEAELESLQVSRVLWCNARLPAVGFYQGMGWRVVSEEFEIPAAGTHVRMLRG